MRFTVETSLGDKEILDRCKSEFSIDPSTISERDEPTTQKLFTPDNTTLAVLVEISLESGFFKMSEAGEYLGTVKKETGRWTIVRWKENQQFYCFNCKIRYIK